MTTLGMAFPDRRRGRDETISRIRCCEGNTERVYERVRSSHGEYWYCRQCGAAWRLTMPIVIRDGRRRVNG